MHLICFVNTHFICDKKPQLAASAEISLGKDILIINRAFFLGNLAQFGTPFPGTKPTVS